MSLFTKRAGGVHLAHRKNTASLETKIMPIPDVVHISMSQHIGAPCKPVVAVGDMVKVGQIIGDSEAFVSTPIHASVSGKVTAIGEVLSPMGSVNQVISIEADKLQEEWEGLEVPKQETREEFLKAVRASGLVGLGGAAFPTHVKYSPKNLDEVNTLIINGAECEPYITSDFRGMMEDTEHIVKGTRIVMKHLGMDKGIIAIESNKPEAIKALTKAAQSYPEISVVTLKAIYPQGAEKVLIRETTGRIIPDGKLPGDVGVIVSNIGTNAYLSKYFETGKPLVSKRIKIDGSAIQNPQNVEAPIGTKISDVIAFTGGYKEQPRKILMGGPMMGMAICDDQAALVKNNNAILALGEEFVKEAVETACIRCGRCMRACPLGLMPTSIAEAFEHEDLAMLKQLCTTVCMNCGCCSYVCPANRPLAQMNKMAKKYVMDHK